MNDIKLISFEYVTRSDVAVSLDDIGRIISKNSIPDYIFVDYGYDTKPFPNLKGKRVTYVIMGFKHPPEMKVLNWIYIDADKNILSIPRVKGTEASLDNIRDRMKLDEMEWMELDGTKYLNNQYKIKYTFTSRDMEAYSLTYELTKKS